MDIKVRAGSNVKILELAGNLDWVSAPGVRQAVTNAVASQPAGVVVNLESVTLIDSSGLAALVVGLKHAVENQSYLCLCNLQSPVRMIFELTRFDKVFEIFVSEEDAVMAAAGQF